MLKLVKNKRGSEMVEAAVVLPLLFLAVVSLIYLGMFFKDVFSGQLEVQRILLEEASVSGNLFSVISESNETSRASQGLFKGVFVRMYSQHLYVINEGIIVRSGGVVEEILYE